MSARRAATAEEKQEKEKLEDETLTVGGLPGIYGGSGSCPPLRSGEKLKGRRKL
jgi:hypothetical protein